MTRPPSPRRSATPIAVAVLLVLACSRTIEEDAPPELVDSRIEPCRDRCTVQLDPECGARPEDLEYDTVDACVEVCAAHEDNGWNWAHQEDGTDACAEEWITEKDCMLALSCEDQHRYFTLIPIADPNHPCEAETDALLQCFYTTPSLDRVETGP